MKFSREGDHIIRCVISEEEIEELGFTIEDIINNNARTQQFMNQIFDLAEQEFDTKFELGMKSVRADIMPDRTISLTFSEHPGAEGVMDHIKDIVSGLLSTIPQKKLEEIKTEKKKSSEDWATEYHLDKDEKIIVLFAFDDLDTLIRYAKQVRIECIPKNQLYKFEEIYFLIIDMTDSKEQDVKVLSSLTDEYAADIFVGAEKRAFIQEHGEMIIKEKAIEQLNLI